MTTLQDKSQYTFNPFGNQHAQEAEELHAKQMQQESRERAEKLDRNQSADSEETFTVSTDDWFK